MEPIRWEDIRVEPLTKNHNLEEFYSVNEDLNEFIKFDALHEQEDMLSRTYLFLYAGSIVGFVSLSADSVQAPLLKREDLAKKRESGKQVYKVLPCILIGRLAVVKKYERQGLGTYILKWAVGLITSVICTSIGCRYITVDPKLESVALYKKSGLGFTQMEAIKPQKPETRYYINLYKLLNA